MIPELEPHPGPDRAPAAASGIGLWSATCHRYRLPADGARAVRLVWPTLLSGTVVGKDAVLEWASFPAYDHDATAWPDGFRACGTGIEVTFDDGSSTRVQALPELDGLSGDPSARREIDWPEQWNHRRLDLSVWAGRRIRDVWLLVAPGRPHGRTGTELVGWVDGPRLTTRTPLPASPAERVIATRGSHSSPQRSRGLTQPLVGIPHGGCYLTPATQLDHQAWTYSWSAHAADGTGPELAGMLMTHAPSIWIGDRAAFGVRIGSSLDEEGRIVAERFSHDDERARPHRYTVTTASGITVDAAAASHAAAIDVDFPAGGYVQFVAPGARLHIRHATWTDGRDRRQTLRYLVSTSANPAVADLRAWYCVRFDGVTLERVGPNSHRPTFRIAGRGAGRVRIEMGTSYLSVDQAEHGWGVLSGRTIAQISADAERAWNGVLGVVDAPTASDDDRRALAGDLYRLFSYPTSHHEPTPDGPHYANPIEPAAPSGSNDTGRPPRRGRFFTDHGFWDTYRTCWPAFHLLAPARAGELIDGFLEHVRVSGWSPRWSAGAPLDAMVGTSFDIVTADAVASGIGGFDVGVAYAAALRNATCASEEARFGRAGMPGSLFHGYVEGTTRESVSWTLEGAINDAGAAVLARHLARQATGADAARLRTEARYLAGRALDYDRLFDPTTRFFRPRNVRGQAVDEPFDPRVWGRGHTETNAWGSRFGVPHDGAGLAGLFGGPEAMGDALDALFAEPETGRPEFAGSYRQVIHEMSEARDLRLGMCGLSNQPAHHVPWMYAFTDRPWRAAEVTAEAVGRLFGGMHIGQGFPGDEDNGEMSAWHLFAQLGLLPLQVGSGEFLIGTPLLPEITLRPLGAERLTIRTVGTGGYVGGVRFEGEEWHRPTIPTTMLHRGGVLEVRLRRTPARWCEPMPTRPFFAPDDADAVRWGDVLRDVRTDGRRRLLPELTDDTGRRRVSVPYARRLVLGLREPVEGLVQLTATLDQPDQPGFTIEADDAGEWRPVTEFKREAWTWPHQTRPFDVVLPAPTTALRLRWTRPVVLNQLQVLVPRDADVRPWTGRRRPTRP